MNVCVSGAPETCTFIHTHPTGLSGDSLGHQVLQHDLHSLPSYGMYLSN